MKRMLLLLGTVAGLIVGGQAAAASGQAVFDKTCKGCHTVMNPKIGDKAAWAPRIARGEAALVASVMKGKAPMPPKGGAASEADVKAAVEYIISKSK